VLPSGTKVGAEAALEADQIIVGKNATRLAYNQRVRALLGRTSPYPEVGDRLVCLRNNHNLGLLNGSIWNTLRSLEDEHIQLELASDDNVDQTVEVGAHRQPFIGEKVPLWDRQDAEEFDHGYALTCHKAQGSQWDNVMIKDESGVFRDERHRWLYTALTRAAKTVTVLQ
jgi:exodeoxyribonuclease-5